MLEHDYDFLTKDNDTFLLSSCNFAYPLDPPLQLSDKKFILMKFKLYLYYSCDLLYANFTIERIFNFVYSDNISDKKFCF